MVLPLLHQTLHGQAKQRKELLLQIAALQVYIDYAKKGYSAVSKGLNFIGDAKKGELNLHGEYFTSLLKINPKVRNYYRTAQIIALQLQIMKMCHRTVSDLKSADLFHGDELDYIQRTFERLLSGCGDTLETLLAVTTDAALELKDDERIQRIDALYEMMLDDYKFCMSFSSDARLLLISKAKEKKDADAASGLYGM